MSVVRRCAIFLVAMLVAAPFSAPLEPANALTGVRTVAAQPPSSGNGASDSLDDVVLVPGVTVPEWPPADQGPAARVAAVVHTVWVSVVNATPTTTDNVVTGLDDEANIRALIGKMNAFWTQESGGRVSIVFGGYEKRDLQDACDLSAIYDRAAGIAFGGRFARYAWVGTNEHLLVLPRDGCGGGGGIGLGSLGGHGGQMVSLTGATGPLALPTALHEFGHNLGFGHANAALCLSTGSADGVVSSFTNGACPLEAYGDALDIMGSARSGATPHLSSLQRIAAGYLADVTELRSSAGVRTATILPLDTNGTGGIRALQIVDPLTQETYVVEYRTSAGADASSAEFTWPAQLVGPSIGGYSRLSYDTSRVTGGVRVLRRVPVRSYPESTVLAAGLTPGSLDKTLRDAHLDAGETFSSVNRGFTLTVKSLNATSGAVVTVAFGNTTAAPVATSTTFDAVNTQGWWTQTAGAAETIQVRATVASGNGKVPSGKVVFLDGTSALATVVTDARGVAVFKLPNTLAAGTHLLAAQFVPSSSSLATSRSAEEDLTVLAGPAASHTSLSVNRASQVYGSATRVAATASVAKVAGAYPAGSVAFLAGDVVLGTVKLGAGGTAVYSLSPTLGVGVRSLTARFTPATAGVRTSTSPAVTLTVAKATSKTVVSLAAPSVKTTKAAVVKVIVTVPGVGRPTGTLTAYANGKVLKTYPMAAASAGKMSITLPKLSVTGVKTITVRYGGGSNIAPATSAGARLTVTK